MVQAYSSGMPLGEVEAAIDELRRRVHCLEAFEQLFVGRCESGDGQAGVRGDFDGLLNDIEVAELLGAGLTVEHKFFGRGAVGGGFESHHACA